MSSPAEQKAITTDAAARLGELRRVRAVLWPDRDDPQVRSELGTVQSQIRACEHALNQSKETHDR